MMKRPRTVLALAVAGLLAAGTALAAGRAVSSEVDIAPAGEGGQFVATVAVRDAASGELLSAPRVLFDQGQPANAITTLEGGEEVRFTVEVDTGGLSASYIIEVVAEGATVARHQATVRLGGAS